MACRDENRRHFALSPTCRRLFQPSRGGEASAKSSCDFGAPSLAHLSFFASSHSSRNTALPLRFHCASTALPLPFHCASTALPLRIHQFRGVKTTLLLLKGVARRGVEPSPSHTKTHISIAEASESERRQSRVQKIPLFSACDNIVDRRPIKCGCHVCSCKNCK